MDDGRFSKRFNVLLAIVLIVALVSIVNLAYFLFMPHDSGQQKYVSGANGKDALPVDYDKIDNIIQQRVQNVVDGLPKPANGRDGKDGESIQGQKGDKGDKGDPAPVTTCRQIEIRQNPETDAAEYRYVGDDIWQLSPPNNILPNACGDGNGSTNGAL